MSDILLWNLLTALQIQEQRIIFVGEQELLSTLLLAHER